MSLTDSTNGMYMPVAPAYMGGGNCGWGNGFGGDGWWVILFLFALMGNGWGNGFGGGNNQLGYDFPWLLNGQSGINNNTNEGFQNAMLNDGITSIRNGLSDISTQLCGDFAGVTASVTNAQNALAQQLCTNQLADLERSFNAQTASTQGMNAIQSQLAQCCCDNRLATNDLKYTIATENCADRAALSDGLRDVLTATQAQTQRILDQLCQDKIDAKNDTIAQLRQELLYARGQASQDVQTAVLRQGQEAEVDALYNRLSNCPVPTTPVYGRTPIFTCNNNSCGCGCGNNF